MARAMVRVGILGAGSMGKKHLQAYGKVASAKVTAIVSSREEYTRTLVNNPEINVYSDLDHLLSEQRIDALDICLPTPLHRDAVVKALDAGLHVIVEKPFALGLEDIDTMIDAARRNKRKLMVAHVCRFMPEYVFAKSIIDSSELGTPLFFRAWRNSAAPEWSRNQWLNDPKLSGGTLMDLQIHDIDLSNWFFGRPQTYYCREVFNSGCRALSHVVSNLTYQNGVMSNIEASHIMPHSYPFSTGYRLVFEKGTLVCGDDDNSTKMIKMYLGDSVKTFTPSQLPKITADDPYVEELSHFTDCLISGADFKVSCEEARLAVETVIKLRNSFEIS